MKYSSVVGSREGKYLPESMCRDTIGMLLEALMGEEEENE